LKQRGLKPWFDEEQMRGGSKTDQLQKPLDTIPSVLILIGPTDLGPWQREEIDAFVTRNIESKRPGSHLKPIQLFLIYLEAGLNRRIPPGPFLRNTVEFDLCSDDDLQATDDTSSICKIVKDIWAFCQLPGIPPIPDAPPLPPPQPWPAENATYQLPLAGRKAEFAIVRDVLAGGGTSHVLTGQWASQPVTSIATTALRSRLTAKTSKDNS
jgi:hypothetical protein